MMRTWAAISAAAVLVALPLSVQQAAGGGVEADTAVEVTDTGAGATGISAADIGVVLWLSVAVIAALTAFLVLRHSRSRLGMATEAMPSDATVPVLTALSLTRPDAGPAVRTAAPSPATGR